MEHVPSEISYKEFAGPESRFCPAKVYEYIEDETTGSAKVIGSSKTACSWSHKVSPVVVYLRPIMAAISPALASPMLSCLSA